MKIQWLYICLNQHRQIRFVDIKGLVSKNYRNLKTLDTKIEWAVPVEIVIVLYSIHTTNQLNFDEM